MSGSFKGSLNGPAELTATALIPTSSPGVVVVTADLTVHNRRGDLYCTERAVLNTSPSSDGEFAYLCEITGGTGRWAGATGYLQSTGTADPLTGLSIGEYSGRISMA